MNDFDPNYVLKKNYILMGQKALIFNDQNHLLLLQRSERSGNGGKWSFAGGALEEDETPLSGIEREIKEETQLEVTDIKPFYVFSYKNKDGDLVVMIVYTCRANKQNVVLNWEHDAYKWVTKEEALQMDLGEHAKLIIKELEDK